MPIYSSKEMAKLIEKNGWYLVKIEGSHYQYKHPNKEGKITIPMHSKDLKKGLANCILKQAGLK